MTTLVPTKEQIKFVLSVETDEELEKAFSILRNPLLPAFNEELQTKLKLLRMKLQEVNSRELAEAVIVRKDLFRALHLLVELFSQNRFKGSADFFALARKLIYAKAFESYELLIHSFNKYGYRPSEFEFEAFFVGMYKEPQKNAPCALPKIQKHDLAFFQEILLLHAKEDLERYFFSNLFSQELFERLVNEEWLLEFEEPEASIKSYMDYICMLEKPYFFGDLSNFNSYFKGVEKNLENLDIKVFFLSHMAYISSNRYYSPEMKLRSFMMFYALLLSNLCYSATKKNNRIRKMQKKGNLSSPGKKVTFKEVMVETKKYSSEYFKRLLEINEEIKKDMKKLMQNSK
jgi:hypothetical protein